MFTGLLHLIIRNTMDQLHGNAGTICCWAIELHGTGTQERIAQGPFFP